MLGSLWSFWRQNPAQSNQIIKLKQKNPRPNEMMDGSCGGLTTTTTKREKNIVDLKPKPLGFTKCNTHIQKLGGVFLNL